MRPDPHLSAVLQALLVTLLWSSSWVLIKIGLAEIPALTFAGLRYGLAFLCLLPLALRRRAEWRALNRAAWARLGLLGLLMYAVTQGAQFGALALLPATTTSLLMSLSPFAVALLAAVTLRESPTRAQWVGAAVYLLGALAYFYPVGAGGGGAAGGLRAGGHGLLGLAVVLLAVFGNAGAAVLGRAVNRGAGLSPLTVTTASMGLGAAALLGVALPAQGLPALGLQGWLIVAWLAVVNTAVAFTLWNRTLRTLPAMTSSLVNNTMLVQIALLAWLFLGERPTALQAGALAVAALGVAVSQLRRGPGGARPRPLAANWRSNLPRDRPGRRG